MRNNILGQFGAVKHDIHDVNDMNDIGRTVIAFCPLELYLMVI